MAIEYDNLDDINNPLSKSYTLRENNIEIGSISGYLGYGNVLIAVVNIFPKFQGKGIGFEAFEKVYNEINDVNQINIIKGVWCTSEEYSHCENGISTNLNVFQKLRGIKSDKESAFLTPSGKWVKKLGFNNVNIVSISNSEVIVEFSK